MGSELSPPAIKRCCYNDLGCLFIGYSDEGKIKSCCLHPANSYAEVQLHKNACGYGRLLRRLEQMHLQMAQKDAEIERLNALVIEQVSSKVFNIFFYYFYHREIC